MRAQTILCLLVDRVKGKLNCRPYRGGGEGNPKRLVEAASLAFSNRSSFLTLRDRTSEAFPAWGTESGDWIACTHLAEERGTLLLHTLSSIEVHSGRPSLPIPPAGLTSLCVNPLVETPLRLVFVPRLDQFGQRQQFPRCKIHPPRRHACRHI